MATESSFPVVNANLDLRGELFQANKESWTSVLEKFENALKQVSAEGNEVSLRRHQTRGQLLRKLALTTYFKCLPDLQAQREIESHCC